ncbi:unnamed protein product, partial [Scytosiphon promiscuus]
SSRLRHPRDPGSPETAYRIAVEAYLSPLTTVGSDTGSPRNIGKGLADRNRSPSQQTRSLSPQRSQWCSPVTAVARAECPESVITSNSVHGCGEEGVPPLLLEPSEWGLGLGGEWVSARRQHTVRGVGRVSLTWADIRGNTLLHLAAIHNDIALVQVRKTDGLSRKKCMDTLFCASQACLPCLARAQQWNERSQKKAAEKKAAAKAKTLRTKDILKRIKQEREEDEKTSNSCVERGGDGGPQNKVNAKPHRDALPRNKRKKQISTSGASGHSQSPSSTADEILVACRDWLPLLPSLPGSPENNGKDGCSTTGRHKEEDSVTDEGQSGDCRGKNQGGDPVSRGAGRKGGGAAVVETLRALLEEAHVRQVVRLAGLYMMAKMNEAEWYHRTGVILPAGIASGFLVKIAAAHPSDTYRRKMARAAIQDYAEEERSTAAGGFWMDRGIKDALDVNSRNQLGETPLILGAQNGSVEVVAALLEENDTDVAALNADGCTALVLAAMLDKTAVVKVLVAAHAARGEGVDHKTANGFSALHWAVIRGNADVTVDLVDAGASINSGRTERRQALWRLPIHKCAEYGSTECLDVLLNAGADPLMEDASRKLGMTAMHIAASKGFLEIMRFLSTSRRHGAAAAAPAVDVNIKHGKTPLHYAVECLQLETVRFILGDGPGVRNENGASPERARREAEGKKLLDASQRTKLEIMLAAAAKEERGFFASGLASLTEFVQKVLL